MSREHYHYAKQYASRIHAFEEEGVEVYLLYLTELMNNWTVQ